MAFPLIIRICHWQKRLFVLCSFSPFSFRVTFFEEKRSFSWCLQLPPISVQSLATTRIFGIDFLVGLFSSGFGRSLKIPRRNNRAGSSPATGTSSETPLTARIPALRRGFLARRGVSSLQNRNRLRWIAILFFESGRRFLLVARQQSSFFVQTSDRFAGSLVCALNLEVLFATAFYASHEKSSLTRAVAPPRKNAIAGAGLRFCLSTTRIPALRRGSMPDGAFLRFKPAIASLDCGFF